MTARLKGDARRQVSYLLQMSAGHSQAGFSRQFSESVVCWFNPQCPNPSDERDIRMMCRPHIPEHHSVSMTFTDVRACVRAGSFCGNVHFSVPSLHRKMTPEIFFLHSILKQ